MPSSPSHLSSSAICCSCFGGAKTPTSGSPYLSSRGLCSFSVVEIPHLPAPLSPVLPRLTRFPRSIPAFVFLCFPFPPPFLPLSVPFMTPCLPPCPPTPSLSCFPWKPMPNQNKPNTPPPPPVNEIETKWLRRRYYHRPISSLRLPQSCHHKPSTPRPRPPSPLRTPPARWPWPSVGFPWSGAVTYAGVAAGEVDGAVNFFGIWGGGYWQGTYYHTLLSQLLSVVAGVYSSGGRRV